MRSFILILYLSIAIAPSAIAQTSPPPIETYGNLPFYASMEISPDGNTIAAITNVDGVSGLITFSLDGKITNTVSIENIKARGISFRTDRYVILASSRTTDAWEISRSYESTDAFAIDLEKNKAVLLLSKARDVLPYQSGLGAIVGDGNKSDTVLMPAYTMQRGSSKRALNLLRANLKTGGAMTESRGDDNTIDWFSDGKGNALIRENYDDRADAYEIERLKGNSWVTIYEQTDTPRIPISLVGLTLDGQHMVYENGEDSGETFEQLQRMDLEGNIKGPLFTDQSKEVRLVYRDDNRRILGVQYAGIQPSYNFLDKKLQQSYDHIKKIAPNATIYLDSWSDDRSRILYRVFEPSLGEMYFVHDQTSGKLLNVANRRPDLKPSDINAVAAINYTARDGLKIPSILTLPKGFDMAKPTPRPLIVLPHGGPAAHDRLEFNWDAQFLASRGYLVLQPNFRGSTGFGNAFYLAGEGEWGGKMQDDLTDGVQTLIDAGYTDGKNTCIIGASYGGYAALAGATQTPDLFKCVVAIAPVTDLGAFIEDVVRRRGSEDSSVYYWREIVAQGETSKEALDAMSPASKADRVQAPILLLHGDDDTVVPIEQSTIMKRALERAGKDVTFVRLKGEDHWLSVAETRLQLLKEIDAFLKEHMPITP